MDNSTESIISSLYGSEIIERFCKDERVFIAGNHGDTKDLDIASYLVNANKDQKCILVPHEISGESLDKVISSVENKCLLFSECTPETDFTNVQVLIIDFLGSVPEIYRYCRYAYIGTGITRCGDNISDAAVYGIPCAFRSKIYIKDRHEGIVNLKIGTIVENGKNLNAWLRHLRHNEEAWAGVHNSALDYAKKIGRTKY